LSFYGRCSVAKKRVLWRNLFAGVVKFTGDCEKAGRG